MKIQLTALALSAALALVQGCGAANIQSPGFDAGSKAPANEDEDHDQDAKAKDIVFDETMKPPQGYYDALFDHAVRNADGTLALADTLQVLWVNFDGASVTKGFGPGQSFIPCKANTTIPASTLSPADKDAIVAAVQQFYDDAGARILVTPAKPATGDVTVMHVGGAYKDLGCTGGNGILGVAPLDQGNANRNDVGFAFTPTGASTQLIGETIAHEAGHSFGLDHVVTETDLMYASSGANITGFGVSNTSTGKLQDAPAILQQVLGVATGGGTVVVPPATPTTPALPPAIPGLPNLPTGLAGLPGLGQLGALGQLLPGLPAGGTLDISQLAPLLAMLLPAAAGASGLGGLDQILLLIGMASQTGGSTPSIGGIPIDPALLTAILGGASGAGGLGSLTAIFGTVLGTGATPVPTLGTLPDLTALLGLAGGGVPDLASLITSFTGSTQVVNANYTGANQAALLSLLKVAYAQQYQTLAASQP